ncbi:hypothetical protein ACT03B_30125, partial [Pseudomonas aeruginosa]|uniref:hypothetical protein n=1 Tax=Pseudomonas aeruginosa TaxID=287 RepID=UPI00402BA318
VKLNRIAGLYFSATDDLLDDDPAVSDAADMVGLVAEHLKIYYRNFSIHMVSEKSRNDPEYRARALSRLKKELTGLKDAEISREILEN